MALTPMRWLVAALASCALIGVALLLSDADDRGQPPGRQALQMTMWRAQGRAADAARLLRAVQLGDSVRAAIGGGIGDSGRVMIDPGLPAPMARALSDVVARAAQHRAPSPRRPVDMVFLADTVTTVRGVKGAGFGFVSTEYLLPRDRDDRCIVLVRIRPLPRASALLPGWMDYVTSAVGAQALVGPCRFYEWFGDPGPQVARWLGRGAWNYGLVGGWQHDIAPWRPESQWAPRGWTGWPLRYYIGYTGLRCASGDAAQCAAQALREPPADTLQGQATVIGDTVQIVAGSNFLRALRNGNSGDALGPRETALLASMARELGPERFAAFWSSELPPDSAFARAAGQPLGDWTLGWSRRMYGKLGRGPSVHFTGVLLGLGLAAAALAIAIAKRQRRETA